MRSKININLKKIANRIENFDDIHGQVTFGTKSFQFDGNACDGLFYIRYKNNIESDKSGKLDLTLGLRTDKWRKVDLDSLPYFGKLKTLFERFASGWELQTSLEIEGHCLFKTDPLDISGWDHIKELASLFNYIEKAKSLMRHLNIRLIFPENVGFSADEHKELIDVVSALDGCYVLSKEQLTKNLTFELFSWHKHKYNP